MVPTPNCSQWFQLRIVLNGSSNSEEGPAAAAAAAPPARPVVATSATTAPTVVASSGLRRVGWGVVEGCTTLSLLSSVDQPNPTTTHHPPTPHLLQVERIRFRRKLHPMTPHDTP